MTRPARAGFTLLEVVLVVALIAMMASLMVPSISAMYGYYKVTAAVDAVRGAWGLARAHAIEDGRPYRFAIVPDSGAYRVAPDSPDYWSGGSPPTDDQNPGFVLEGQLPPGVRFTVDGSAPTPADDDDRPDDAPAGDHPATGSYTGAIVFLPDGTARDDAVLRFDVRNARPMKLQLRALTGGASAKYDDGGP